MTELHPGRWSSRGTTAAALLAAWLAFGAAENAWAQTARNGAPAPAPAPGGVRAGWRSPPTRPTFPQRDLHVRSLPVDRSGEPKS